MSEIKIGIALGGGGARGLSHIAVLQAIDDLGVAPCAITGTSIGALIGAGYAGGVCGDDLEQFTLETFGERNKVLSKLWQLRPKKFTDILAPNWVQLDAALVVETFAGSVLKDSFEELVIPFTAVAADYYTSSEVPLTKGPLIPAISGSICIPFLFKPVLYGSKVLIDGGVVNPLPFDQLPMDCDIILAVDVVGTPVRTKEKQLPSATDSIFGAMQILQQTISYEKIRDRRPDLLIRPPIEEFQVLDFLKADTILKASKPVREAVKAQLGELIEDKLRHPDV